MRSASRLPLAALLCALLLADGASAGPARLGDFSVGGGLALVVDRGSIGGGPVAEANLLYDWFSLGLRLRGAFLDGGFRPAAGLEASAFGLLGLGVGLQEAGPSIDGLLQIPVPIYRWRETYLTLGYRPSLLLREPGGWVHEIALQIKWSSLLVPEED